MLHFSSFFSIFNSDCSYWCEMSSFPPDTTSQLTNTSTFSLGANSTIDPRLCGELTPDYIRVGGCVAAVSITLCFLFPRPRQIAT